MILLVGGEEGGSGKSCLAQNLAVYLKIVAGHDVLLLDADPQGTTMDWVQERNENEGLVSLSSVQASGNIRKTLIDLAQRYQDIVIDAGGHDSEALRSASTELPAKPERVRLGSPAVAGRAPPTNDRINPNRSTNRRNTHGRWPDR